MHESTFGDLTYSAVGNAKLVAVVGALAVSTLAQALVTALQFC